MECEEITKLVDGVYKNILEKFNPGARQLITAGKGYLKALHGAASASRLFNEALAKIALNAQQSGTNDIGAALLNVVSVYKEIQEQQMNILKAFYVDLLVPLETNLEKDTKVVQHEQKKFLQQHKVRMESYQKAVSTMKKQRKKKSSPENTEKELRSLQILEDQKKKLDAFCDQSYKNAMTQERRRYGFVLERQCSIAKHWMAYHSTGKNVIDNNLENWQDIAASREVIPTSAYENSFNGIKRLERLKDGDDSSHAIGNSSQLKKSRSVDAPYGDMRTLHETSTHYSQNSLPRAKSDFNLTTVSSHDHNDHAHWDQRPVAKALYAYMPSGENQLPFDEGDRIALVGTKAKGWQFGENLRTQMFGWFPIAYTNADGGLTGEKTKPERNERHERYENMHFERNGGGMRNYQEHYMSGEHMDGALESDSTYRRRNNSAEESSPTRMFGDTINFRNQKKYRPSSGANPRPGPPPTLPAPVPSSQLNSNRMLNTSQSFCAPNGMPSVVERRKHKAQNAAAAQAAHLSSSMAANGNGHQLKPAAAAKTSLHSSNDSGFANEPPPQPEIDYSDEEQNNRVPIRRRADTNSHMPRDMASWTLNRNFRNSVDSQIDDKSLSAFSKHANGKMRYDLIASDDEILQASSGGIKRTKSFWKFGGGRTEDILAGMSLWQHRDLVAAPNLEELRAEENNRKTSSEEEREHERDKENRDGTLTKSHSNHSTNSSVEKARKESITSMEVYDEDENIYGVAPIVREGHALMQQQQLQQQQQHHQLQQQQQQQQQQQRSGSVPMSYTPKSRMKIMKTIEIDIENPTEGERLSTIKRGQKEYQKEYRDMGLLPQAGARNSKNVREREREREDGSQKRADTSGANGMGRYPTNGHKHAAMNEMNRASQPQSSTKVQPQGRAKSQNSTLLHSTEDECDSDDNGTLKMSDVNNFFDDLSGGNGGGGGLVMKTVKRKDILKQYYTSEDESDDVELKSTSSDPYDCIVINDHLVRKDEKHRRQMQQHQNSYHEHQMEFQTFRATSTTSNGVSGMNGTGNTQTSKKKLEARNSNGHKAQKQTKSEIDSNTYNGSSSTLTRNSNGNLNSNSIMNTPTATILPRTRLMKSSNTTSMTLERTQHKSTRQTDSGRENSSSAASLNNEKEKNFGKTYGPWYDFWDQQDQHHTLVSQKSAGNSKMK